MSKLIWRLRFTMFIVWTFRSFGWRFSHVRIGWSESTNTKYKHMTPREAALEEIGSWYS